MDTHRSAETALAGAILAMVVGGAAVAPAGCERNHAVSTTAPTSSTPSAQGSATDQPSDGGSPEAASYAHLERLYKELAGPSSSAPKQPWASLAQQMAYMHQLATQGRATGPGGMGPGPGMMGGRQGGGPGMMGGQQPGGRGMGPGMMGPQGTMMGGGPGTMWQRACGLDEWNRRMAAASRKDAQAARAAGDSQGARTLDEVAKEHDKLADQIGSTPSAPLGTQGAEIFAATCAPCHRPQGEGVPGVFPPLQGDPVVNGPDEHLIRVVLEGLNHPLEIRGQRYFGVMPSFAGRLDDATLAAVLTYIRSAWGNSAPPVTPQRVAAVAK